MGGVFRMIGPFGAQMRRTSLPERVLTTQTGFKVAQRPQTNHFGQFPAFRADSKRFENALAAFTILFGLCVFGTEAAAQALPEADRIARAEQALDCVWETLPPALQETVRGRATPYQDRWGPNPFGSFISLQPYSEEVALAVSPPLLEACGLEATRETALLVVLGVGYRSAEENARVAIDAQRNGRPEAIDVARTLIPEWRLDTMAREILRRPTSLETGSAIARAVARTRVNRTFRLMRLTQIGLIARLGRDGVALCLSEPVDARGACLPAASQPAETS